MLIKAFIRYHQSGLKTLLGRLAISLQPKGNSLRLRRKIQIVVIIQSALFINQ